MTGAPRAINRALAGACDAPGIPLAVGLQRVALEHQGDAVLDVSLRAIAPSVPILANFGATQINRGLTVDHARRAVEASAVDALIIHPNPCRRHFSPRGDPGWSRACRRASAHSSPRSRCR